MDGRRRAALPLALGLWDSVGVANFWKQVFPSAAYTATHNTTPEANTDWRGLHLIVNVTAVGSGGSVTPVVNGYGPTSDDGTTVTGGVPYPLLTGLPITSTGTTVLKVHPGIMAVPNGAAQDFLPYIWFVEMQHANAVSITYSVYALMES